MTESLQSIFRNSLQESVSELLADRLSQLESGDFHAILQSKDAQELLGRSESAGLDGITLRDCATWNEYISIRLSKILSLHQENARYKQSLYFIIGYAALLAFLQSNATGPPLSFTPSKTILPRHVAEDKHQVATVRRQLIASLAIDGIAAFRLTPNIELLCLAKVILNNQDILESIPVATWARLRVTFMHQRLLSEDAGALQDKIFKDVDLIQEHFFDGKSKATNGVSKAEFLLERASIETFYGLDSKARIDLDEATAQQGFQFALTGLLGRRTKFQQHDVSQLVVLAKSAGGVEQTKNTEPSEDQTDGATNGPKNLDLNDDTLLESISFTKRPRVNLDVQTNESLPPVLAELDPADQPKLLPLDSIILLALASSITNTSPGDGLTREETLPYAERVLNGGSSNWQVYTQALLVRSRMEGYKSRTIERGLLQLQAVVDQVIADTTDTPADGTTESSETDATATTFLRKGESKHSAPACERLRYIFQIAAPTRWELEAELAQRWVTLGGLRSALDIYMRLEMWAEVALCYAATEKEDSAKKIARRQLFHATNNANEDNVADDETWEGAERQPPPADAARLYCIIGDIDQDASMFEKAWEVSGQRYARAQRSLGRMYIARRDMLKAADAYAKSLKANQLNHSSWFAMGCCLLELSQFEKAAEAFSRTVQLEESDAEAWSNLAAALLKNQVPARTEIQPTPAMEAASDEEADSLTQPRKPDPQQNKKDALRALKRAASLKHDSHRIWENLLIVAASLSPPDYDTVLTAQRHIIDLRAKTAGESCIDVDIMAHMLRHVIALNDTYDAQKPGFARLLVELFDKQIVPLITSCRALWQLYARLCLWRDKPAAALDASEKAWRAVTAQPGWETESVARWNVVVDATVELCDAYESLGPREKNEGMAAGSGVLVAKDWKFKARSAIRGIMGKGRDSWEDSDGWERLKQALDGLKA
jgi:tetratricopeptide (TPR) repeat protein